MLAVVPFGTGAGADPDGGAGGVSPQENWVAGSGRARANLFEIIPRTGGLEIPINFGKALATYRGLSATATSGGVKPPSQQSAEGDCGGAQPPGGGGGGAPAPPKPGGDNPTAFPFVSTLSVSTGDEGAENGREIDQGSFPPNSPISGRFEHQQVWAKAGPSARAVTTSASLGLSSAVEILHGRTDAEVAVLDRRAREAHAVTTIDRLSLFDGQVVLVDVRWEAIQRTGEGERAEGTFSVGQVLFGGSPLPLPPPPPGALPGAAQPALPDPLAALNTALAPSGISIVAPHFETAGAVARVTPMSIRFADSALGRVVLGPVVTSLQPLREQVVGGLLAISCDFGIAVTIADVATSILTGSGGISFDFGGVTATTEGEVYDNPFAGGIGEDDLGDGGFGSDATGLFPDGGLPSYLGGGSPPTDSGPLGDAGLGTGSPADFGASTGAGLGGPSSNPGSDPAVGSDPSGEEVAYGDPAGLFGSTSRHVPGRKGGPALAVAALALLTVAALAAADAFHLRRASRSIS